MQCSMMKMEMCMILMIKNDGVGANISLSGDPENAHQERQESEEVLGTQSHTVVLGNQSPPEHQSTRAPDSGWSGTPSQAASRQRTL